MRLTGVEFAVGPLAALRDERLKIGAAVAVVVGPLDADVECTVVDAVAVFINLQDVSDLISASIGRPEVAVFVQPAHAFAVPPAFEDVGFAVAVDVHAHDLVGRCCRLQRGLAEIGQLRLRHHDLCGYKDENDDDKRLTSHYYLDWFRLVQPNSHERTAYSRSPFWRSSFFSRKITNLCARFLNRSRGRRFTALSVTKRTSRRKRCSRLSDSTVRLPCDRRKWR